MRSLNGAFFPQGFFPYVKEKGKRRTSFGNLVTHQAHSLALQGPFLFLMDVQTCKTNYHLIRHWYEV